MTIQLRTEALAQRLAETLRAAQFAAVADPAAREVRVELSGQMRALATLLHTVDDALADQANGQARIRVDGRSYLLEPRGAASP